MSFLTENRGSFRYCTIRGNSYTYEQIMETQFDMEIFNNHIMIYVYYYVNGSNASRKIDDLQIEMQNSNRNYIERCREIQKNEKMHRKERKEALRKKIEENDIEIMNMHTLSLVSLLEKYGTEEVFSDDVRENKILVYLLKKGFINENYADYINYFHPKSITSDEMNYIRGIRMEEPVGGFAYRIQNVAQVCDKIEDYEFKQVEALNYDVTDYLITKINDDMKCIKLFEGLAQGSDKAIEFIKSYVERNQNISIFIKTLCKHYPAFWKDICNNESFSEDSKFKYLSLIFSYASIKDVERMNEIDYSCSIKDFILERKCALARLGDVDSEKMIQIIKCLYLWFVCIDIKGVNKNILEYIFEKNHYKLNIPMVTSLFEYKYPKKVANLKKANYTTIREVSDDSLMRCISNVFEKYVTEFVLGQDTNICEDIHAVEDILRRLYKTNPEICKEVLDKENVIWDDFNDCCSCDDSEENENARKVIWNHVLENELIVVSWHNFLCYYNHY